jgi:hypothetical protein
MSPVCILHSVALFFLTSTNLALRLQVYTFRSNIEGLDLTWPPRYRLPYIQAFRVSRSHLSICFSTTSIRSLRPDCTYSTGKAHHIARSLSLTLTTCHLPNSQLPLYHPGIYPQPEA